MFFFLATFYGVDVILVTTEARRITEKIEPENEKVLTPLAVNNLQFDQKPSTTRVFRDITPDNGEPLYAN